MTFVSRFFWRYKTKMQVTIMANQYIGQRGYTGAVLKLPAGKAEIADALACAHTPSEKEIALKWFEDWPQFLDNVLEACGEKKLEEVNLLAYKLSQMNEAQLNTYEGAIKLRQEDGNRIDMKELINICYNLDSFVFQPDILNDNMLGELCLMGELLDVIQEASDEVLEMLDEEKVGQALRKSDKGVFTTKGYLFFGSDKWTETYDGMHLPEYPDIHEGVISLRLNSLDCNPEKHTGVWLDLPAGEMEIDQALKRLEVSSLNSCIITEVKNEVSTTWALPPEPCGHLSMHTALRTVIVLRLHRIVNFCMTGWANGQSLAMPFAHKDFPLVLPCKVFQTLYLVHD